MKIVIINGSARKGNTLAAINAFIKGASEKNKIEIIEPDKLNIAPCKGCGVCQCSKGCVDKDDTNSTIDKIAAADMILFATPVYWWGMSEDTRMKIVIINGSARKGNTLTAINAFIKGASEKNEIEIIEPDKLNIAPCKGCGVCQCSKGCVDKDDTNPTIDKIAAADMILFATPVYWWGMSAQLKLIIDKCYCRGLQLKNKKVGTIVVGGSPVDSIQYELIDKQFDCMAKYLSWDMLFKKSYYATARDELEKNKDSMNELEGIGKNL